MVILQGMKLSELKHSEKAVITKVKGKEDFRRRITEMGFVKGHEVFLVKRAPLNDPIEFSLMGYNISLRKSEAELIEIETSTQQEQVFCETITSLLKENKINPAFVKKGKRIKVLLIGNPNCGKTTIFNSASNSHGRVGNFDGATVDYHLATFQREGYTLEITDLPGIYSLSTGSSEELFARKWILDKQPDIIVNVVDATNLERNLFLTTQLIDMNVDMVLALNMHDELKGKNIVINQSELSDNLGMPIIPTVGITEKGIDELFSCVINSYKSINDSKEKLHIDYDKYFGNHLKKLEDIIETKENKALTDIVSSRYLAIKALENDPYSILRLRACKNFEEIHNIASKSIIEIEEKFSEDGEQLFSNMRYQFIANVLRKSSSRPSKDTGGSDSIDAVLTHKYWGFPLFIFFMWLMFQSTFTLGGFPNQLIENAVGELSNFVNSIMETGPLKDLLLNGVISGIGGIICFFPSILILYFCISLIEDTGYMARTAFIMDRLMRMIGLNGKSFIPLLMGFGCNVPAIMSTRTLTSKSNRILTMLINPFMSCSARLPIYILLIGAFFPNNSGIMLFSIYFLGISIAVVTALILKQTAFKYVEEDQFLMELPPYRMPSFKGLLKHMWWKSSQYLRKITGVVMIASILVWALGYYPRNIEFSQDYESQIELLSSQDRIENDVEINKLILQKESERYEKSYIARVGKFIEPAIAPLGFDWKIGVSLLTGIVVKEIVVS
ncbi:MAG: ferrous iron transport protein B, partial [Flavobacteriales bacterium]|nr:ferrous iron transport protein B [Flavobacteriales bacterium]